MTQQYTPDKTLSICDFKGMTDEWLDFIVDCRKGIQHNYDIVIGAMANDQIYNYIEDFIAGVITREHYNSSFYYDSADCIYQSYLIGKAL